MSLSLFEEDNLKRVEETPIVSHSDPGAFDGFFRGTGQVAMKGFAEGGRALSMAGAAFPVLYDAVTGGTEASDSYFRGHDDTYNSAVDYWTPKPEEVGIAGQVTGTLLSTIPMVIASPGAAVAKTQMSTSEDLVRAGVDSTKAQTVGAVHGASLGFGVWLPILGKNMTQRVLIGGALANVVQGAATRGISGEILEGTPADGQFKAFDGEQLSLDVLLGLAFGATAHISPKQRAQGAEAWEKIGAWAERLKPSDVDALAVLRQAQHLNVDSVGGKVQDLTDIDAHVARARKAIDQMSRDESVNVDDFPAARIVPDQARQAENEVRFKDMVVEAERVRVDEGLPKFRDDDNQASSGIVRNEKLTPAETAIESRFARQVESSPEEAFAQYAKLKDSEGGKVLSTDVARELSSDYLADRTKSSAVHEPASWLIKQLYAKRLAEAPKGNELPVVFFTGGGTGSGKTTGIKSISTLRQLYDRSQIIYDTNLKSYSGSKQKIDDALSAGKTVVINYVVRDPIKAYREGVLKRAARQEVEFGTGRIVPMDVHADTHAESLNTVRKLSDDYANNDNVIINIVDNNGAFGKASLTSLSKVSDINYNEVVKKLPEEVERSYANGEISKTVYEATKIRGAGDAGVRAEARADVRGQSEPQPRSGSGTGKEASGQEVTPSLLDGAASRFADENPTLKIHVGSGPDGTPITKSPRQLLDEAQSQVKKANEDANLFRVAAECLFGLA